MAADHILKMLPQNLEYSADLIKVGAERTGRDTTEGYLM